MFHGNFQSRLRQTSGPLLDLDRSAPVHAAGSAITLSRCGSDGRIIGLSASAGISIVTSPRV
jgi:hypothetical protein